MSRLAPLDEIPPATISDLSRDQAAPGFIAHIIRAFGSLDAHTDVLDMLGLNA